MVHHSSTIIAPSILAANFGRLESEIHEVEKAGASWLHIDIMDGSFVPPITFGDNVIGLAKSCSSLFLDVHLMIMEPERHLEAFAKAGAGRIIVHAETSHHLHRLLLSLRAGGVSTGVAINPATPASAVTEVLELCDLVLVMTVNPGWGGQAFIPAMLSKIRSLQQEIRKQNLPTLIEVDGGIVPETAKQCVAAGASVLVAGSYIFGSSDRAKAIAELQRAI